MFLHPSVLIAHLKKNLLIVEINIKLEHVISCELLNILFVFPDFILYANDLRIAILIESCPNSSYLPCPVKLSFMSSLGRDLLLSIKAHQVLQLKLFGSCDLTTDLL